MNKDGKYSLLIYATKERNFVFVLLYYYLKPKSEVMLSWLNLGPHRIKKVCKQFLSPAILFCVNSGFLQKALNNLKQQPDSENNIIDLRVSQPGRQTL